MTGTRPQAQWADADDSFAPDGQGLNNLDDYQIILREVNKYHWRYFQFRAWPHSETMQVDFWMVGDPEPYASSRAFELLRETLIRLGAQQVGDADYMRDLMTSGGQFYFSVTKESNPNLVLYLDKALAERKFPGREAQAKEYRYFGTQIGLMSGLCPLNVYRENADLMKFLAEDFKKHANLKILRSKKPESKGKLFLAIDLEGQQLFPPFAKQGINIDHWRNYFKMILQLNAAAYEMSPDQRYIIVSNERAQGRLLEQSMLPEDKRERLGLPAQQKKGLKSDKASSIRQG